MGGQGGGYHTEDLLALVASVFLVSNAHVGNIVIARYPSDTLMSPTLKGALCSLTKNSSKEQNHNLCTGLPQASVVR